MRTSDKSSDSGATTQAEQVAANARMLLRNTPYAELRNLTCEYHEGMLVLRGRVDSYYLKQLAQSQVARLRGIELIDNRVEVQRQPRQNEFNREGNRVQ